MCRRFLASATVIVVHRISQGRRVFSTDKTVSLLPRARAIAAAGGRCWGGCSGVASRHRALAWCAAACVACVTLAVVVPVALVASHVYRDYSHLPDPGPTCKSGAPGRTRARSRRAEGERRRA